MPPAPSGRTTRYRPTASPVRSAGMERNFTPSRPTVNVALPVTMGPRAAPNPGRAAASSVGSSLFFSRPRQVVTSELGHEGPPGDPQPRRGAGLAAAALHEGIDDPFALLLRMGPVSRR